MNFYILVQSLTDRVRQLFKLKVHVPVLICSYIVLHYFTDALTCLQIKLTNILCNKLLLFKGQLCLGIFWQSDYGAGLWFWLEILSRICVSLLRWFTLWRSLHLRIEVRQSVRGWRREGWALLCWSPMILLEFCRLVGLFLNIIIINFSLFTLVCEIRIEISKRATCDVFVSNCLANDVSQLSCHLLTSLEFLFTNPEFLI